MPAIDERRRPGPGSVLILLFALALGAIVFRRASTPIPPATPAAARPNPAPASARSEKSADGVRERRRVPERWPYVYRVIDSSGFIDRESVARIQTTLVNLYLESGADMRFELVRDVSGDLASWAHERMRTRGIGRESGGRGMLVVYDITRRQLRLEVGPGLDSLFPESFLADLAREGLAPFLASGDPVLGMKAMMIIVANRFRQAALADGLTAPASVTATDSSWLSNGAGVTVGVPFAGTLGRLPRASDAIRAKFAPQPTVAAVHALYLERLRDGHFEPDLPMFTPSSEGPLRAFPLTRPYADFIFRSESGQQYRIVERGDLAILYFTTTPFVSSHLFRRSPAGWQLDLGAEVRDTRENIGGPYTWEIVRTGDDYLTTFADLFADVGGALRPRDGDNRPLPVRKLP